MQKHYIILFWALTFLTMSMFARPKDFFQRQPSTTFVSESKNSWLVLEELLISQPRKTVNTVFGQGGVSVLASLGTAYLTYKGTQWLFGTTSTLGKVGGAGAGISLGVIQYFTLNAYLLDRAEHQQIALMMKLWPQIRDRIPHEVWPSLDTLHNAWLNDQKEYSRQVDAVLLYLKMEVCGRFPGRYKDTSESFFTSRNLRVRVSLNLYKVFKKTYKAIKELLA